VAGFLKRDPATIGRQDTFCDHMGLDSITKLELLATVEEHHGVSLRDEQISEVTTLKELVGAMRNSIKGATS